VAHDYITANLNQRFDAYLQPRRQHHTRQHWQHYPALASRDVQQAAAVVADANHPDHNTVAAALLAAHRDRPGQPTDTEMILLLAAARPLVLSLDPTDRYHDSRASLWMSVAARLARLTPGDITANPTPFLVALYGRIRPDAAKHPSEPAPLHTTDDLDTLAAHRNRSRDEVADIAIARIYLAAARRDRGWNAITRYVEVGRTRSRIHPHTVARHRRRIAQTIGYVA
jgi:hypothetical protein